MPGPSLKRSAGRRPPGPVWRYAVHFRPPGEEMLEHYKQFFKRVQVQNPAAPLLTTQPGVTPPVIDRPFTDAETAALLAYLRKL